MSDANARPRPEGAPGFPKRGRGLVLGKFMPPHLGHVYLVELAERYVDELTVVVGTLAKEPIPGALRFAWMREMFPRSRVVHLDDELPQEPSEHPDFWALWEASLRRVAPYPIDYVFASEDYGAKLAEILGATFVPVDRARVAVPVSGTRVRNDPMAYFRFLPRCVRPYFAKRVCIFGPESTGKTTLAQRLAAAFDSVMVPEYARTFLESRQGERVAIEDIGPIARGQIASEEALAREANRVLFCDTDVLATTIWSDVLFGDCPAWVREEADRRAYDLYLVCDVDVPYVADPVRYLPEGGAAFFARCTRELDARKRPWLRIAGTWDERFTTARDAVSALLGA